jgi:hypothetical protein
MGAVVATPPWQATFLSPVGDAERLAQANPSLAAQLEGMTQEELDRRCR